MQSIAFRNVQHRIRLAVCLLSCLFGGEACGLEPASKPWVEFEFAADVGANNTHAAAIDRLAGVRLSSEQNVVLLRPPHELRYEFKEKFPDKGGTIAFWVLVENSEANASRNTLTGDRRVSLLSLSKDGRAVAWLSIPDYGPNPCLRS